MGSLRDFLIDVGRNAYGLGENVASLGSAAIAEPVAGYAAMFDPANGAAAIREGMTYQPRTEAGRMYQQGLFSHLEGFDGELIVGPANHLNAMQATTSGTKTETMPTGKAN